MFQLSKKNIIIILLIWIVLIVLTILLALYSNKNIDYNPKENDITVDYKGINYYSLYNENDLIINKIEDKKVVNGKTVYYTYIKIEGLKNKDIENKINEEIYDYIMTSLENGRSYVYTQVEANFSNILSVLFYTQDDSYERFRYDAYNYDLTTGNEIKFEDLFTNNANISSILYGGFYDRLSTDLSFEILDLKRTIESYKIYKESGYYNQYYEGQDINEILKNKEEKEEQLTLIEDIVGQKVREYKKLKLKKFYITNHGIYLIQDNDNFVVLKTKNNSNYFAYYEKYKTTESIFENDNIGKKNLFLSSGMNSEINYNIVEYVDDYGLLDFETESEISDKQIEDVNKIITKYKNKFDKDKFTYLNIDGTFTNPSYYYGEQYLGQIQLSIANCTMSKDYFKSTYIKKLFESKERSSMGFYNFYYDEEDNNFTCSLEVINALLDFDNNIYDNIKDVFVSGFDYEEYLKQKFYEYKENFYWGSVKYTDEEKAQHKFKFKIHYGEIDVSINDETSVRVKLNDIPSQYLNIKF